MGFTGDYNRCSDCGYIYDFNDSCPECGSTEIECINANEVKKWAKACTNEESKRLNEMLQYHGD